MTSIIVHDKGNGEGKGERREGDGGRRRDGEGEDRKEESTKLSQMLPFIKMFS